MNNCTEERNERQKTHRTVGALAKVHGHKTSKVNTEILKMLLKLAKDIKLENIM
jgi:hypothetical protein